MATEDEVSCADLREAILSGTTSVRVGDKTVVYRSLADMIRIHEAICGPLAPQQAAQQQTAHLATSVAKFCRRGCP